MKGLKIEPMKKIEFLYVIFSILILIIGIFISIKYFAKNNNHSVNEEHSSIKEEITTIPFPSAEILSANLIKWGAAKVPAKDLKGLNEYLNSLKGIQVTSKNIMFDDIKYELNISGVVFQYSLVYKKANPYLYYKNVIWKIDLKKLNSFF